MPDSNSQLVQRNYSYNLGKAIKSELMNTLITSPTFYFEISNIMREINLLIGKKGDQEIQLSFSKNQSDYKFTVKFSQNVNLSINTLKSNIALSLMT